MGLLWQPSDCMAVFMIHIVAIGNKYDDDNCFNYINTITQIEVLL